MRLFGLGAPEMDTIEGALSRKALDESLLAGDNQVSCEIQHFDSRKRPVAICSNTITADMTERMIGLGWGFNFRRYTLGTDKYSDYDTLEKLAQKNHLGFWREINAQSANQGVPR